MVFLCHSVHGIPIMANLVAKKANYLLIYCQSGMEEYISSVIMFIHHDLLSHTHTTPIGDLINKLEPHFKHTHRLGENLFIIVFNINFLF